ncbi:MAG: EAL domain-containing protein [Acidiferrobacterales bacterium]
MRDQVRARQQHLETILDTAAESIITFNEEGIIENINLAAEKLFGYDQADIVGQNLMLIIPIERMDGRDDYIAHFMRHGIQRYIGQEGEITGRHKNGSRLPLALKISAIGIDGHTLYTGLVADISERKAMLENLKHMAEHDGLTGLYNRSFFQKELNKVSEQIRRSDARQCALLYIDLDNFKYVNDTMGHAAGDRLLIEVSEIFGKRVRKSDLLSRFCGDEFIVLLIDATPEKAYQVAESFRTNLTDYQFMHEGKQVDIHCSIGVAQLTPANFLPEDVMSQADLACHLAKKQGRNRVHVYNDENESDVNIMSLDMGRSRRIKIAIEQDHFVLAYQPIVNTQTRQTESYEVLVRLVNEQNEIVMPGGFLPSAERFGLAADIDRWVIVHAMQELSEKWQDQPELHYSINLSGMTLSDPEVCDLIEQQLKLTKTHPTALTFEVTETVAIGDMAAAVKVLSRIKSLGCQTALDDFGTGMSSFAYLRDLPVDIVKIDGRFVKNLAKSPVDQAMVRAMNDIAHALGKTTVAEFVEDEDSFQLLRQYGIDYCQGYLLGKPELSRVNRGTNQESVKQTSSVIKLVR